MKQSILRSLEQSRESERRRWFKKAHNYRNQKSSQRQTRGARTSIHGWKTKTKSKKECALIEKR